MIGGKVAPTETETEAPVAVDQTSAAAEAAAAAKEQPQAAETENKTLSEGETATGLTEAQKEEARILATTIVTDPRFIAAAGTAGTAAPSDVKSPQPTIQNDGQPTGNTQVEDNAANIAELEAKINSETTSPEEKAAAQAELDNLKNPATVKGGRRRTKRKQQKKGGKSSKKGGKKHRKSSGSKSRRSSSKKSRRQGRK